MKFHTHKPTFIAIRRCAVPLESIKPFPGFIFTNPVKTRLHSNTTCLLAARSDVVNDCFTFQQQTPDFIGLAPWPLDNPDLNSVD